MANGLDCSKLVMVCSKEMIAADVEPVGRKSNYVMLCIRLGRVLALRHFSDFKEVRESLNITAVGILIKVSMHCNAMLIAMFPQHIY